MSKKKKSGWVDPRQMLRQASAEIHERRATVLARVLETDDLSRRAELIGELDEALAQQAVQLASLMARFVATPTVVRYAAVLGELLDAESNKFLKSSETMQKVAVELLAGEFDYALPTTGLWKTVERELNLSLVWFLRIRHGVADRCSPWVARLPHSNRVEIDTGGGQALNLNEYDPAGGGRLRGVMLGPLRYLLCAAYDNGVSEQLAHLGADPEFSDIVLPYVLGRGLDSRKLTKDSLPWLLQQVGDIRNRHAHVEAMPREIFDRLEDLVLAPTDNPWASHLGRILAVKRRVLEYVERTKPARA